MRVRQMKSMLEREDGFTLVELMVVVAIMATLLLMSLTTYSGVKARAQDSGAKQIAAQTLKTGRVVLTDTGSYATVDTAKLTAAEKSITFVDGTVASTGMKQASTDVPDRATTAYIFVAAVYSPSGNCFYIRDWLMAGQGVAYGTKTGVTTAQCTAADTTGVIWYAKWN
jgi:prepilin-type N-terminal cleavage/methylation domain-containing protein